MSKQLWYPKCSHAVLPSGTASNGGFEESCSDADALAGEPASVDSSDFVGVKTLGSGIEEGLRFMDLLDEAEEET